jgi:hypothetical protein
VVWWNHIQSSDRYLRQSGDHTEGAVDR